MSRKWALTNEEKSLVELLRDIKKSEEPMKETVAGALYLFVGVAGVTGREKPGNGGTFFVAHRCDHAIPGNSTQMGCLFDKAAAQMMRATADKLDAAAVEAGFPRDENDPSKAEWYE